MRSTEIALLGFGAIAASSFPLFQRSKKIAVFLAVLSLFLLGLHVLIEGWRLQAVPLYLGLLMAPLLYSPGVWQPLRVSASVVTLVLVCLGAALCYSIPVISFPAPDGQLAIGTQTFFSRDMARTEQYGPERGHPRRVAFQIWYPAAHPSGPTASYRDRRTLSWKTYHLRYVETHAYSEAVPLRAGGPWPIVFFSPSSGGYRSQNTYLTESLVSRGYIVVGFDHANTSSRVAFPDGLVAHSLPDVWLDLDSRAALKRSLPKTESILATNVEDMRYALNMLQNCQPEMGFAKICQVMDFGRVAAVGHSFGGAAAAELCRLDSRFRTGVNMDGWMFGDVNASGVPKPFLFMIEGGSPGTGASCHSSQDIDLAGMEAWPNNEPGIGEWGDQHFRTVIQSSIAAWGGCSVQLLGATHGSFADMVLYRRSLPWAKENGIAPETEHRIIRDLVRAFLDETLKGQKVS
ncbi:MAG: platelet-activating factor acetylhydrolase plasma/intracellular isoform, partial [Bryobacterales bacterium]|nr:platelet-activating factor acetylhydrolase plasma/intracellular isoform [Bryobacterales bacterium]